MWPKFFSYWEKHSYVSWKIKILIKAGSNDDGETISVSEEDIPAIMEELRKRLFQNKFRKSI